jgi:hypothetical protein
VGMRRGLDFGLGQGRGHTGLLLLASRFLRGLQCSSPGDSAYVPR